MKLLPLIHVLLGFFLISSCKGPLEESPLLVPVSSDKSGIDFTNALSYTEQLNPYTFKNFYNGAGVAIGDINNDGLSDIFFCGNQLSNKLYLNDGELTFKDITSIAGVESSGIWSTGVSMVDINADGWLDIYVCKSGAPGGDRRHNELFINNGDLTFTEKANEYGLDNVGLSVHAAFLDFDKDGDLDCYLLNNSITSIGNFGVVKDQRLIPDSLGANKFYRNDNGYFNDITIQSGIYSSEIGFGLGAMVGDINYDNWPDIYISNDFFEKDYLYINQKDGTFQDKLEEYVTEISMGSMGADLADVNNDGHPEYFVTEMLPERRDRQVTKAFYDTWEGYRNGQENGYYNQFGRNVLQLNNGDGTFSEIGRYAGIEATDWSWAALIFDVDNDGLQDIFIANGIYKDLLDMDYLNFMANPDMVRAKIRMNRDAIKSMIDMMPTEAIPNYFYRNNGDLTFENKAVDWKLDSGTFSNGSAYGDLDNDGDLDLVVNNVNMPAIIYENRTSQEFPDRNYLTVVLEGSKQNPKAIGAKVWLYSGSETYYREQNPIRGFQSSVDYKLVVGLGDIEVLDSIEVLWPSDRISRMVEVKANQVIKISENNSDPIIESGRNTNEKVFEPYENKDLAFVHTENVYNDFRKDRLLFHMSSTEGPCVCKGDVNNDGKEDIYFGGAAGQGGQLQIQSNDEQFITFDSIFFKHRESEDLDCSFLDANGDGNMDLYVASGGSEFGSLTPWLNDRLYFGDGSGKFIETNQRLPSNGFESTSCVIPLDFDGDGDLDLFVGGRSVPFFYGVPADSYLLENDGKGDYSPKSGKGWEVLARLGMVTAADLGDMDGDGTQELIVVGRWMPIKIFSISRNGMEDISERFDLEKTNGWYNDVFVEDLNNDGNMDLIVGNHGLNTRFHASAEEPLEMIVGDFDSNGTFEQVLSMYYEGEQYPFVLLKELGGQLPTIANQFSNFDDYKDKKLDEVFSNDILKRGQLLKTYTLASGYYINDGRKLHFNELPLPAQLSPVYAIKTGDFTGNGKIDIILGGNFAESKPEVGSYLGSFVALLEGGDNGQFKSVGKSISGLNIKGAVRNIVDVRIGANKVFVFARNDEKIFIIIHNEKDKN